MDITDTQQAILAMIAERIEADGLPPSQTEIARAFGFGVRAAQYHLKHWKRPAPLSVSRARGIRIRQHPQPPQVSWHWTKPLPRCCACRCWGGSRPVRRLAPMPAEHELTLDPALFSPCPTTCCGKVNPCARKVS